MLENIPVGIDRKLELVVFDWTPDRLAVEAHENRGYLAHIQTGWITLDTGHVLRTNSAFINVSEHAIERDDAILVGNILLNLFDDLLRLFFRQRLEIGLGDLQRRKLH